MDMKFFVLAWIVCCAGAAVFFIGACILVWKLALAVGNLT